MEEGLEQLAAQAPAGRPARADEIAEAIVFLATDRASFIHGAKLAVDGGRTAIRELRAPTDVVGCNNKKGARLPLTPPLSLQGRGMDYGVMIGRSWRSVARPR